MKFAEAPQLRMRETEVEVSKDEFGKFMAIFTHVFKGESCCGRNSIDVMFPVHTGVKVKA